MTIPIQNDHLPANHQDVGNLPLEDADTVVPEDSIDKAPNDPASIVSFLNKDPVNIQALDKNQLGLAYEYLDDLMQELDDTKGVLKEQIFHLMKADSEEAGNYLCYYSNKFSFPDLTFERAKDLGLTKVEEKINKPMVNKAYKNGVDLGEVVHDKLPIMRRKKPEEGSEA